MPDRLFDPERKRPPPINRVSEEPTFWAVLCPHHGRVFLTEGEYDWQMNDPDRDWTCPVQLSPARTCNAKSEWDDENFESTSARSGDALSRRSAANAKHPAVTPFCTTCVELLERERDETKARVLALDAALTKLTADRDRDLKRAGDEIAQLTAKLDAAAKLPEKWRNLLRRTSAADGRNLRTCAEELTEALK